ncbi:hypothetical protein BJ508DRAFT_417074 [Ascobolus immersus RN42]|uniref:DUF7580 domain-containing protein n=1 Tax=Ascobolus immersus RN42 TaxID=1160509 RepID=A0A3N4I033_ASCIM|nr:hypothetical protein BJ508DRAFT_417074 [Ascobolus immersus RN42]
MAGLEIVGVVLGVLPLVHQYASVSSEYYQNTKRKFLSTARNKSGLNKLLVTFYEDLRFETYLLQQSLDTVFGNLTSNSFRDLALHADIAERRNWDSADPRFTECLRQVFRSDLDMDVFTSVIKKVLKIFFKLTKDVAPELKLSRGCKDYEKMGQVVKRFQSNGGGGVHWHFHERRQFLNNAEQRDKLLDDFSKANKRLRQIIESRRSKLSEFNVGRISTEIPQQGGLQQTASQSTNHPDNTLVQYPSTNLRNLSSELFGALRMLWNRNCDCKIRHEAGICLAVCRPNECTANGSSGCIREIGMVVWRQYGWTELTVAISPTSDHIISNHTPITQAESKRKTICEALELTKKRPPAFHIQIEPCGTDLHVERMTSQLKKFESKAKEHPDKVSLRDLLESPELFGKKPRTSTRLKIASLLAHALFQLYESPWSSSRWDKDHLAFLYSEGKPDYDYPYLNTTFEDDSFYPAHEEASGDAKLAHRKIGLLKLAVLLLEVYKWKPLNRLRRSRSKDSDDSLLSSEHTAALHLYDKYKHELPEYFKSVAGCLNMPWREDRRLNVSLEDEDTRRGIYRCIIQPLDKQMEAREQMDEVRSTTSKSTKSKSRGGRR